MTNRFLHNFLLISLLSGSCYAAPGDKVFIQLLPEDQDLHRVHQKAAIRLTPKETQQEIMPSSPFATPRDDDVIFMKDFEASNLLEPFYIVK